MAFEIDVEITNRNSVNAEADINMLTNESGDIINEIADIENQKGSFKTDIESREADIRHAVHPVRCNAVAGRIAK